MKRFTSIFLVFNIILCYSGFQPDVVASTETAPAKTVMSCHGNVGVAKESSEKPAMHRIHGPSGKISSCCLEGLTNAPLDPPSKIDPVLVHTVSLTNMYYQRGYVNRAQGFSQREHDPPDLQIVNSTFLL
ncbi:MAG: hypothetical protein AB1598_13110 [Thermodesulfobacteriota bacterium]